MYMNTALLGFLMGHHKNLDIEITPLSLVYSHFSSRVFEQAGQAMNGSHDLLSACNNLLEYLLLNYMYIYVREANQS